MIAKKNPKILKTVVLLFLTAMLLIGSGILVANSTKQNNQTYLIPGALGGSSVFTIDIANIPDEIPQTMSYYRVLTEVFDEKVDDSYLKVQNNIPSEEEARAIFESYISTQGGLPDDAIFKDIQSQYLKQVTDGEEVNSFPLQIEITYRRVINEMPVVGPGDFISVSIGENGKVLCYFKTWRTLEEAGQIVIISRNEAITNLEQGKTIDTPISPYRSPVTINSMCLGYYAKATGEEQQFYKPVWIFKGIDAKGEQLTLVVEAIS